MNTPHLSPSAENNFDNADLHGWRVLAERGGIGGVLAFRLNWLVRDLRGLQLQAQAMTEPLTLAELQDGPFARLLARLQQVEDEHALIRRQTQEILGATNAAEVQAAFDAVPKFADFLAALEQARSALQDVVDRSLAQAAVLLRQRI